jgi:hypothetical protein
MCSLLKKSNIEFKPFEITFKIKSIEELQELYDIIGDLKDSNGSGIVYEKIGMLIENAGFTIGIKCVPTANEIEQAANDWFNKTEYCDQKDGFIAGAKWRKRKINAPSLKQYSK